MRIGIVTGEYPPMQGGVGAYSQVLARHFILQGHKVFVFSSNLANEPDPAIPLTADVGRWNFRALWAIRRWANENMVDVISLQFETAAYQMSPWIHFLPDIMREVPVVTTFHDLLVPYLFPKAGRLRAWIVNHLARASDGVIVTNQEDMLRLRTLPRTHLIPIGSNILTTLPADFTPETWRAKAGASPDDFLIAHFGFINRSKGVHILMEDVALIREKYKYPLKVVMIGGRTGTSDTTNAAYVEDIDRLIERLGLAPHVYWTGFIEDDEVSAFLTASDAVVLPFLDGASYRRGSLMAAVYHGCAIITSEPRVDIPLFIDSENMLLARAEIIDPDAPPFMHVACEILELYRKPDLRERLRKGAKALASNFGWSQIADNYVTFFKQVIGGRA